jgi:hypothetical protein
MAPGPNLGPAFTDVERKTAEAPTAMILTIWSTIAWPPIAWPPIAWPMTVLWSAAGQINDRAGEEFHDPWINGLG